MGTISNSAAARWPGRALLAPLAGLSQVAAEAVRRMAWGLGAAQDAAAAWLERSRQRQALARLDPRQLEDLGLPRDRVMRELTKWFWQA